MTKKKNEIKFQTREIKKRRNINDDYKVVIAFLVVLVIIAGLVALLFYFNGKFVSKDLFQKSSTTTTTAKYDETLLTIDSMFKVTDKEYYVLLFDSKEETSFLYSNLKTSYEDENVGLYMVDLGSKMNKKYYDPSGKENTSPKKASEVLIVRPTLIKFKNGKITSYITEKEEIVKKLS